MHMVRDIYVGAIYTSDGNQDQMGRRCTGGAPKVSPTNTPSDFRDTICSALMFSNRQLVGIRRGN